MLTKSKRLLLISILFISSCNGSFSKNETKTDNIQSLSSNGNEHNKPLYAGSLYISKTCIKTYFGLLDSITPCLIEKERINDKYPFFRLDNIISRNYIENYNKIDESVYAISKQYSNENFNSIILLHTGDCTWDFYLMTIDKKSNKLIDSHIVLYDGTGCAQESLEQVMKTVFKGNRFETTDIFEYNEDKDTLLNDTKQKIVFHVVENTVTRGEILSNGSIKTERQCSREVIPLKENYKSKSPNYHLAN